MSFSDFNVIRRTRKGNFFNQIDRLIDWQPLGQAIRRHYAPVSDVVGRPAVVQDVAGRALARGLKRIGR